MGGGGGELFINVSGFRSFWASVFLAVGDGLTGKGAAASQLP